MVYQESDTVFSEALRAWRINRRIGKRAITQSMMATKLSVPLRTYIAWEKGLRTPDTTVQQVMLSKLG